MLETSPLHVETARAGAQWAEEAGWQLPSTYGDPLAEYHCALEKAAVFDVSNRSKIEVAGPEAGSFLQNLSTNDIAGLPIGAGCETFFTTMQAKVVAHALAYHLLMSDNREAFWLDAAPGLAEKILKHLDHYLISEQVELADHTREFAQIYLAGPQAKAILERAIEDEVPDLAEHQHMIRTFGANSTCHIRRYDALGVPGYEIISIRQRATIVWGVLLWAGAAQAGLQAYEWLRVEAGTPVYGKDVDETNLALEVGRTPQTISYSKGCFLGQEPLVRIRDLGHVNRTLTGLKYGGGPVSRGAKLFRDGKEVGYITSSVVSPRLGTAIGLAYVRRGHQDPDTTLEIEADGVRRPAEVVGVPFASVAP
jgi:folate-binding protein YgfZ